ncbi:glucose-6-phosphatase catalytic subunit 2 [Phyllostomus discolor]|uniref:Glucose-6-phosphatase catalytic subunit 2 n=1 Tax=Phyllostomus discolor TaxID=89673 RepID=A0A834AM40_9CHIR|nr:glucose-6-phosphatase catalytic subunit 2 [Phyllostomus discolor]
MDFLHRNGVLIIQHLQKDYRAYYNFLSFMSNVGDPRNIFSIYFPLWFQLNQTVGTKMIWVAVVGDWFNLIFKWKSIWSCNGLIVRLVCHGDGCPEPQCQSHK